MPFNSIELDITYFTVEFLHKVKELAKKNNFVTSNHGRDRLVCVSCSCDSHDWFNFVRELTDLCYAYNIEFENVLA